VPRPREPCSVFGTDYGRRCTASTGAPRAPHTTITNQHGYPALELTAITGPRAWRVAGMVAGVIASRVFPAEPLNHRSLATARRQMKRSEIGTLTIMVRRVPDIPVDRGTP
jgi:hypothetical protein